MKPGIYIYFFKRAWFNCRASLLLNVLTAATVTLAMLVLLTFSLVFHNVNSFLSAREGDVGISVYLKDGISEARTEELRKILSDKKEFAMVRYISKAEAMKTFLGWNRSLSGVITKIEDNPLPASFEVSIKSNTVDSKGFEKIVKDLSVLGGIEDIRYSAEWFEKLKTFVGAIRGIGIFVFFFLVMATTFLISNTIRLNIYARRDEINISRLVGATDLFIKMPFMIEGLMQVAGGTLTAWGLVFLIYRSTYGVFDRSLSYIIGGAQTGFLPSSYVMWILGVGAVLGIIGTDFAVRRFLRAERE